MERKNLESRAIQGTRTKKIERIAKDGEMAWTEMRARLQTRKYRE